MLKSIAALAALGWCVVWAQEREISRAMREYQALATFEYREVAACVDERYMIAGDDLENATRACELRFVGS
jgi:hypothetical protein